MAILVLGLGNTIMTDDGFGVRVVETLSSRYCLQGEVRLLDGGTLGLDLLPHLEGIEQLLIQIIPVSNDHDGRIIQIMNQFPRIENHGKAFS